MPKQKTHSGAKKRIKITGSGKLLREHAGKRHLLERKSSKLTRRHDRGRPVGCQEDEEAPRPLGPSPPPVHLEIKEV